MKVVEVINADILATVKILKDKLSREERQMIKRAERLDKDMEGLEQRLLDILA